MADIIYLNEKYNNLTVIEIYPGNKDVKHKCLCDCGNITYVTRHKLVCGNTKSCGCLKHRCGIENPGFKGFGEISGNIICSIKKDASKRNILYEVSTKYLWNVFLKQDRKCIYTGIELTFPRTTKERKSLYNASLDRIDSSKGYIEGNIQWVDKRINLIKFNLSEKDFLMYCKLIIDKYDKKE